MGHPPNIPLTPQTNEQNFPTWQAGAPRGKSGHAYPRMLTRPATKGDREEWRDANRRSDERTGRDYWEGRPPKVGDPIPVVATLEMVDSGHAVRVGEPIGVDNPEQERELLEQYGHLLGLEVPSPQNPAQAMSIADMVVPRHDPETERLERENAALRLQLEQIELQRQLKMAEHEVAAESLEDAPRKGGWPKGKPRKPQTPVIDSPEPVDE